MKNQSLWVLLGLSGVIFFYGLISNGYAEDEKLKTNYEKAVAFLQEDQFDLAIEYFENSLKEDHSASEQARIYNLIGMAYLKQGVSSSSALGSFEQAIKLDPQFAEAYFNIASAYAGDQANSAKAVEYFRKTIEVDPQYFKAYFGLGWFMLMRDDDPNQAIEYFEKTVEKYPDFSEAYYGIGLAYVRTGRSHRALGAVSKLREMKRDDLAAVLEKAVSEASPVSEPVKPKAPKVAPDKAQTEQSGQAEVQARGTLPVEVVMKGKVIPPKEESAAT